MQRSDMMCLNIANSIDLDKALLTANLTGMIK